MHERYKLIGWDFLQHQYILELSALAGSFDLLAALRHSARMPAEQNGRQCEATNESGVTYSSVM